MANRSQIQLLLLTCLIGGAISQGQSSLLNLPTFDFSALPTNSYLNIDGTKLSQASPKACRADCQSCQIQTGQCEECYAPYFRRTPNAECILNNGYLLESGSN